MKYITFVRHAKSSWDSLFISDYERPLNTRGERDSIFMGKKLFELGYKPQLIVTSTAERAQMTAKNFAKGLQMDNIIIASELFDSSSFKYLVVISKVDNSYDDIMIVGHNPILTAIINNYNRELISNVPTSGLFKLQFDVESWDEVNFNSGKLIDFIYPKMFENEL